MDKTYQKANRPVKKLSLKSSKERIVPVRVKRIVCLHVLSVMEIKAFTFKILNAQTFNNDNIRQNLQVKTVAANYTSIYFTRVSKVKMLLSKKVFSQTVGHKSCIFICTDQRTNNKCLQYRLE